MEDVQFAELLVRADFVEEVGEAPCRIAAVRQCPHFFLEVAEFNPIGEEPTQVLACIFPAAVVASDAAGVVLYQIGDVALAGKYSRELLPTTSQNKVRNGRSAIKDEVGQSLEVCLPIIGFLHNGGEGSAELLSYQLGFVESKDAKDFV